MRRHVDQTRASATRNLFRAVGAAIVRDDHLARDGMAPQKFNRFGDAGADGLRFVEAWNDDHGVDRMLAPVLGLASPSAGQRARRSDRKLSRSDGWSTGDWKRTEISNPYRVVLLRAISAGHFPCQVGSGNQCVG